MLISGGPARVSGHLDTALERVRHGLGRSFARAYRIPPRAARTAGVIRSVYAPSGSKTGYCIRAAPYPSVYASSGPQTGYCIRDATRTQRYTPRAALKRGTAFALPRPHRYTPRAALRRDTAFAMYPYPSVYVPSGSKTGYCIRVAPRTPRYTPRAASNVILHSCTLGVLSGASMTYSVDTACVDYRDTARCGLTTRYCARAPVGIRHRTRHARHPVSGVDDIPRRYCARRLTANGPCRLKRDTALVRPSVSAPGGPKRDTILVHARLPVSGVDTMRRRYCARKLTVHWT